MNRELHNRIISFVHRDNDSSLTYEPQNSESNRLTFATRKNGDSLNELYSSIDLLETELLVEKLKKAFDEKLKIFIEPVDEWVMLTVTIL